MNETRNTSSAVAHKRPAPKGKKGNFVLDFHGVRYQVKDVSRSVAFYTAQLGFKLKHQQLPAFANVSLGNLDICSAARGPRARDACLTVITKSPAAGIEWSFGWLILGGD